MQQHLVMLYWRVNYSLYVEVKQLAFNFEFNKWKLLVLNQYKSLLRTSPKD